MQLLLLPTIGYPYNLICARSPIRPGDIIMGAPAVATSSGLQISFRSAHTCGGDYTPGESIDIHVPHSGTFVLDAQGGTFSAGPGITCDSRQRLDMELGSEGLTKTFQTDMSASSVNFTLTRGIGMGQAVDIGPVCTLYSDGSVVKLPSPPPVPLPPDTYAWADSALTTGITRCIRFTSAGACQLELGWHRRPTSVALQLTLHDHAGWLGMSISADGSMTSSGSGCACSPPSPHRLSLFAPSVSSRSVCLSPFSL